MASLVEAKGKTRSTTGRMIPSSMRDVISRADVLRQLNGKCAHTTRARVDENFLSLFQTPSLDQRLPSGQADHGDGSRFFHGECFGLDRHVIFFDRNELR